METNENFKKVLMELFDEKDIDQKYRKQVEVDEIMQEYRDNMAQFKKDYEAQIQQERIDTIKSLTKDELELVLDLYGQEIFSMYEKKNNVNLECIVR